MRRTLVALRSSPKAVVAGILPPDVPPSSLMRSLAMARNGTNSRKALLHRLAAGAAFRTVSSSSCVSMHCCVSFQCMEARASSSSSPATPTDATATTTTTSPTAETGEKTKPPPPPKRGLEQEPILDDEGKPIEQLSVADIPQLDPSEKVQAEGFVSNLKEAWQSAGGDATPPGEDKGKKQAAAAAHVSPNLKPIVGNDGKVIPVKEQALWPDAISIEEIQQDELHDAEGAAAAAPDSKNKKQRQDGSSYVMLGMKALLYGTVLAILGTAAISFMAMKYFQFASIKDVLAAVGGKADRDLALFKEKHPDEEVVVLTLDLTNPATLPEQVESILATLQLIAESQAAENDATERAAAKASPSGSTTMRR